MQNSKLKFQQELELKTRKQYRAIRLWIYLQHIPFETPEEMDAAAFHWITSGCAKRWNDHFKRKNTYALSHCINDVPS